MKDREPTKQDFLSTWPKGYMENFQVYHAQKGASESDVVSLCLQPWFNKDHYCLEIGCGACFWPRRHLCNNFKHVYGLDYLQPQPFSSTNFTYIEVPDRDYSCFGIPDCCMDFVWSFGVFCHMNLDSVQEYLHSIYRVLKPGGRVSLYFSNNDRNPGYATIGDPGSGIIWVRNDLQTSISMLEKAGFRDIVDLMPGIKDTMLGAVR